MSSQAIADRDKGSSPCSIGTSLALESIGGFGEFPNDNPPIRHFDNVWINIRTLWRNAYNAINAADRGDLTEEDMVQALVEDMYVIQTTLVKISDGRISQPVFYLCRLESLEGMFPLAIHKRPKTDRQILQQSLETATLPLLGTPDWRPDTLTLREYDVKIMDTEDANVLMLTHYPLDLLWRDRFGQLTLLESHTGTIKPRSEWYTKLTGGKRYDRIPFNAMTMQVMGDGNLLFASMSHALKQRLVDLAEAYDWHSLTTEERIQYTLGRLSDRDERQFFEQLLKRP